MAEERLLELVLANQELRKIDLPKLEPGDYESLASAIVFRALVSLVKEDKEIGFDSLSSATADDPQASELLARLMMTETSESFDESLAAADKSLKAIKLLNVESAIEELRSQLAEAQRSADDDQLYRLAMEEQELKKRRASLLARSENSQD